jgi:hypothetical protein
MAAKVTLKDKGLRKLRRELERAAERCVVIGVGEGANAVYPDGTTVQEVAIWNHFGTANIPARPFISATIEQERSGIRTLQLRLAKGLYLGKVTLDQALEFIGQDVKNRIVTKINDFFPPPNAPSTIAAKKSSQPLVDTKQMVGSIDYEIRDTET